MDGHQHQHQHQHLSQNQQSANAQTSAQQTTHAQPPQQLLAYVTGGNQCENCRTTQTCMWRRGGESGDMLLCNKCGLYYTRKGYHRPQLNRKPTVRRRTNKRRKTDLAQNPGSMLDASIVPSSSSTPSPGAFIHHTMASPSGIQKPHRMTVGLIPHQQQHQHQHQHHHHQQPLMSLPPFQQGSSIAVPIPGPYHHTGGETQNPESDRNNTATSGRGNTPVMLNVTREQASQLLKGIKKAVGIPDNDSSEETKD